MYTLRTTLRSLRSVRINRIAQGRFYTTQPHLHDLSSPYFSVNTQRPSPFSVRIAKQLEELLSVGHIEAARKLHLGSRSSQARPEAAFNNLVLDVCNTVIDGCSKSGRMDTAVQILNTMIYDFGVEPDVYTFGSLLEGFCNVGNVVEARSIFDRIPVRERVSEHYVALIAAHINKGDLESGRKVYEQYVQQKNDDMGNTLKITLSAEAINALGLDSMRQ